MRGVSHRARSHLSHCWLVSAQNGSMAGANAWACGEEPGTVPVEYSRLSASRASRHSPALPTHPGRQASPCQACGHREYASPTAGARVSACRCQCRMPYPAPAGCGWATPPTRFWMNRCRAHRLPPTYVGWKTPHRLQAMPDCRNARSAATLWHGFQENPQSHVCGIHGAPAIYPPSYPRLEAISHCRAKASASYNYLCRWNKGICALSPLES